MDSAGYDIYANDDMLITSHPKTIDTGIVLEDSDFDCYGNQVVGLILPRSSYGFKYGLEFSNTIGVIDMDYRDTIKLKPFVDFEHPNFIIERGERYAQLIFVNFYTLKNEIKPETERNGGIGSTGKKWYNEWKNM